MSKKEFKSGFVAIVGRPNVGKSTLLNAFLKDKVSIISPIPQTTRHQIKGILNEAGVQIVFVDTPGMHNFKDKLSLHLNTIAKRALEGVDLIIYVVDVSRRPGAEENRLIRILTNQPVKTIMVLNKTDLGHKFLDEYIALWQESVSAKKKDCLLYYIMTSALKGKKVEELKEIIIENLPQFHPYYDKGTVTDFPIKFRMADIIREKLFLKLAEELPHDLAVEVDEIRRKKTAHYIKANIYVKRSSQKKIVVGKKGQILKDVGRLARIEIEKIIKKKVFLDIWVTVSKDWQNSPRILKELGYWWA